MNRLPVDLLTLAGMSSALYGLHQIYPPLSYLAAGFGAIALARQLYRIL